MGSQRVRHDWVIELNWIFHHRDGSCFIYLLICGCSVGLLPSFWLLWIMLNTGIQVSEFCVHFSGYIPKSGIAGSPDNSMSHILRNCQTVFHSKCMIKHYLKILSLILLRCQHWKKKKDNVGLAWWSSDWESSCWCRGCGFHPLFQEDSACRGVTEAMCLEPKLCDRRSHCNEKPECGN